MSLRKVPALNLNDYLSSNIKTKDKFIKDLFNSVKEYGFVVFSSHPVSRELLEKAYDMQKQLFNLSEEDKMKYFINNGGQRGYTAFRTENAKDSKAKDLKEFWHVGRELTKKDQEFNDYPQNVWPTELKDTFLKIYNELEKMADLILEALEPSLKVENGFFSKRTVKGNSILRLLHYPPVADGVEPAAVRAGQHTDIDVLTILVASTSDGLELLDKNGKWIPVDSGEDGLVVNIGDMLARIAPDLLSTVHRVVNPDVTKNFSRYSMPFFHHFRNEVVLSPIDPNHPKKQAVVTANDFLMERLKEIGLKK